MIRALFRWTFRFALVVLVLVLALLLFKDELLRRLAERHIRAQTGLRAEIGHLHVGFTEPVFTARNVKLFNHPDFGGGLLLDLPELHLEYLPEELRAGRLRLTVLRLDLRELNIVRTGQGQTNVVRFLEQASRDGRKALERRGAPPRVGFAGVDTLQLSLGTIRYRDLANPARNREARFDLRDLEIKNIRDQDDLYGVAAIVLLHSGVIGLGKPETPGSPGITWPSVANLLEWLRTRLAISFPARPPTNAVPEGAAVQGVHFPFARRPS